MWRVRLPTWGFYKGWYAGSCGRGSRSLVDEVAEAQKLAGEYGEAYGPAHEMK